MLCRYYIIQTSKMLAFKCDIKKHYTCNSNKVIHILVEEGAGREQEVVEVVGIIAAEEGVAHANANDGPPADAQVDEKDQQGSNQEQDNADLLWAENEEWGVDGDADLDDEEEDEATRLRNVFEEDSDE